MPSERDSAATASVVGKVRRILSALERADAPLGLSELARRTGLAKTSVHSLCNELVDWGAVERAADAFQLGPALFELGQRVPGRRTLRDTALPFMEDLFVATRETIHPRGPRRARGALRRAHCRASAKSTGSGTPRSQPPDRRVARAHHRAHARRVGRREPVR